MNKKYNEALQEKLEQYLKREEISQAKAAPMIGISSSALSQYRRSSYEKGNIEELEKKLEEFFKIKDEQEENSKKAEPYRTTQTYIPTSISEGAYKLIRYCQLEKGIVVIDGDAGIGKTKAAAKFLQDNPSTTVYLKASPSTGTLRSLLKNIARALKLSDSQRTDDLSFSIQDTLRNTDKIIIIDEAQNLKFAALEEISRWTDEDLMTGKPGVGIVLIGNVEVYNRMLGKQEAMFAQQFNRSRLHGRYRTTDVRREDVTRLFPALKERDMADEISYLYRISHSKWGIRGAVNVFNNAVNNEDISLEGLEKMANTMGIRFI
ncbi:AAA family ATPase [Lachnospiraceae bacterium 54-53]